MAIVSAITALAASFTAGTFLSTLGSFALKTIVGLGLSRVAQSLAGNPPKPVFSVQVQLRSSGEAPRSFIMGRGITSGLEVYSNVFGSTGKAKNAYFVQVIALSDIPVDGLDEFWVNGDKCTILYDDEETKGFTVEQYKKDGDKDLLFIRFYDGTQTAADPFMVSTFGTHPTRPWDSSFVGKGVAYAIVTARTDEDWGGVPEYKFVLRGMKLYDPSKDTTVGGSGAHRWDDRSTWGGDGDDLTAVQVYNLLRGITFNGKWLYGLQSLPAARLPVADWITSINKCRLLVPASTGTEAQYRSGGEIMVDVPTGDALDQFMTACHGKIAESGGVYNLPVGAPDASVASLDDGTIISTQEQSFSPFLGLADTINGISGKFPNPAEAWNMKDAPAIYRDDLEALDGNRRLLANPSFDLVPYPDQVQRLMKAALEEARRARRHTFVLPPEYWGLEPGDTISWTSARNGYSTKLFRVDGVVDREDCDVLVDLTEVDPADFNPAITFQPIVSGPTVILLPEPQAVQDFNVIAVDVLSADNRKRPGLKLTWNGQDQDDVVGVAYQVRLASTLVVVESSQTTSVATGEVIISPGSLIPTTPYEVSARFIPGGERRTLWTPWLVVTTTNAKLTGDDLFEGSIDLPALSQALKDNQAWIGGQTRSLRDEIAALSAQLTDQDFANFADKQQLRTELGVTRAAVTAAYTSAITVASSDTAAVAARVDTLEVTVPGKADATAVSALSTTVSGIGGALTATSNALVAVAARTDRGTADGRLKIEAIASPDGVLARLGLQVSAESDGTYRAVGMFFDVSPTSGQVIFQTDKFVITDGVDADSPFVFEDGVLKIREALIPLIRTGRILSPDESLDINADEGYILFSDDS